MRWLLPQKAAEADSKGKTQLDSKTITLDHWKKEYRCDLMKSGLEAKFRDEIITYGELVQAAYDNLGQDQGRPEQWGNAIKAPEDFLAYLRGNYRLAVPPAQPGSSGNPGDVPSSTYDRYELPAVRPDGLSPLFEGLPGKGAGENPDPNRPMGVKHLKGLTRANQGPLNDTLWAKLCKYMPALLVNAAGGDRTLFGADEEEREPRGTFFGFVALSKPKQSAGASSNQATEAVSNNLATEELNGRATGEHPQCKGLDVALVWRGTIFKEEWESNFCENQLDVWDVNQWDYKIVPKADQVGVHAGFCDLYTRPVEKPNIIQPIELSKTNAGPSPRTVVHKWLKLLMREDNIATITATGHSLGGGLATLCAYDVALLLKEEWKNGFGDPDFSEWKTKQPPAVRMVTFAAPRAGNAAFVEHFHRLSIEALRVVNKGDIVPLVPGIQTQGIAWFLENFTTSFRGAAQVDTTHPAVVKARQQCKDYCRYWDDFPQDRQNPQLAPPLADTAFKRWLKSPGRLKAATAAFMRWLKGPSWLHVWGFFHVGQALKLNAAWVKVGPKDGPQQPSGWRARFLKPVRFPDTHNLELHLYIISLLQPNGPPPGRDAGAAVTRNPLLLNKSADILAGNTYPKGWWADKHGCRLESDGRWVLDPRPALEAAAAAAQGGVAAAEPAAAPLVGLDVAGVVPAAAGADSAAGDDVQPVQDQQDATATATVTSSDADGKPVVSSNTAITVDCRDAVAMA